MRMCFIPRRCAIYCCNWPSAIYSERSGRPDIHSEWMEALLRNDPHRERAALERTRVLMDKATRDCLITGYEELIPSLVLPDRKTVMFSLRRLPAAAM